MADTAELKIKITAEISKATTEFGRLQDSTKQLRDGLDKTAKRATIAFAGLATVIGLTTKAFGDFENKMYAVKTLMIDVESDGQKVEQTFKQMTAEALELANNVPVSIDAMTTALFDTVSAGVDAGDAVAFVGEASKLAVAGVTDVSIATDGMTSAFNAWGDSAGTATDIAGKFFTAQKFGKTTVADLAGSIGQVSSLASQMGVSLDETLASVSALTLGGLGTAEAFTQVRSVLVAVAKQSDQSKKVAKEFGIDFTVAGLKAKGFAGFIADITEKTEGNVEVLSKLFGRVEGLSGVMALGGKQAEVYAKILKELGDTQKVNATLAEAYEQQSKTLNNQIALLKNQFRTTAIALGTEFVPVVRDMVTQVQKLLLAFKNMTPAQKKNLANTILFVAKATLAVAVLAKVTSGIITLRNALIAFRATTIGATIATSAFLTALLPWVAGIVAVGTALTFLGDKLIEAENKAQDFKSSNDGIIAKHKAEIAQIERKNKYLNQSADEYQKNIDRIAVLKKAIEGLELQKEMRKAKPTAEGGGAGTGGAGGDETGTGIGTTEGEVEADAEKKLKLNENLKAFLEAQGEITSEYDQATIERLNTQYQTEADLQAEHLDALVAKANEANALIVENEQMSADKKLQIAMAEAQSRLSLASQAFGALTSLMGSNNRTLFEIGKASAIAQMGIQIPLTAMNVYSGFVKAFGAPVGTVLGIAGAVASVAFGATKLAEIASTQFNPKGAQEGIFDFRATGNNEKLITTLSEGESIIPRSMTDALRAGEANLGGDTVLNLNIGEVIGLDSQDVADKIGQAMNEAIQSDRFKETLLQGATS